jgi:hypothetical protein
MKSLLFAGALCALLACPDAPRAVELLANGDFEQPLTTGWLSEIDGTGVTIDRQTFLDDDLDYEARIAKTTGLGYGRLGQIVDLPGTDALFRVRLKCSAEANLTAWVVAGVMLTYRDASGGTLGETFVGCTSHECPWVDTPTFHQILTAPGTWESYAFTLQQELTALPGVDPWAIASIRVALYSYAYDC